MRAIAPILAFLLVSITPLTLSAQEPKVESQLLLAPDPGAQYAISPKGLHVAGVVLRGSRQVLVYDGADGPKFDQVLNLSTQAGGGKVSWSDDGSRYAYHGKLGQEYVIVVDGKEASRGPWSADLQGQGRTPVFELGFSPGGKHWYAVIETITPGRTNYRLLLDGVPGPLSQQTVAPLFSPDGEHHTYIQKIDPGTTPQVRYALIVDAKPAPYLAGDMQWTGDSKHLLTKRPVPGTGNEEVLADGQPFMRVPGGVQLTMAPVGPGMLGRAWTPFQGTSRSSYLLVGTKRAVGSECTNSGGLDAIYMSPDGKHYAARCAMTFMYVDGKKGQEYPEGISHLVWTADGRPVYYGRTNQRVFMIIGDQESNAYGSILDVPPTTLEEHRMGQLIGPAVVRGTHVAYIARPNANDGMSTVVVVDGKAIPSVAASEVRLSPDGTRFAYLSGRPATFVTVDGTPYDKASVEPGIGNVGHQGTIHWSPDSKHVAWITAAPNYGVMLDGKLLSTPGMTRFAHFTATGHLVYLARGQGAEHQVYMDGKKVLTLPQNLPLENEADMYWQFGEDGSVSFVAQDAEGMKRFRIVP